MNVSVIRNAEYVKHTSGNKNKVTNKGRNFRSDLVENLSEEAQDAIQEQKTETGVGTEYCQGMMSTRALHNADKIANSAVEACEVRKITYDQCDYVKLCPEQGIVYKTQLQKGSNQVYVEEKKEDGSVSAYLVDLDKVSEDTKLPVELAAKEAAERATNPVSSTEEEYEKALEKFYVYAKERVKEGPPKFAIGAAELSIEEWEKLRSSVDKEIDAMREDMRDRIEEKEEDNEKKGMEELIRIREQRSELGPYSSLMGDGPELVYNGVVFTYDQSGALCLGDTSNPDDVITVYLTGGVFKMNRGSIGDLSKAISMFSPEDINRILQAISQDAKCQNKLKEIEDALYHAVDQTMDEKEE